MPFRALSLFYIGKGYAKKEGKFFMPDFKWLRGQASKQ
jgi:hypothetical protein